MKEPTTQTSEFFPPFELPRRQFRHHYTFEDAIRRYSCDQKKKVSYGYLNAIQSHLKGFVKYLTDNENKSFYSVRGNTLVQYRDFLWKELVEGREGSLGVKGQIERLRCVLRFFHYLYDEGILSYDLTRNLNWEDYYKTITQESKSLPPKLIEKIELTELDELKLKFLEYASGRGFSQGTVKWYKKGIEVFYDFIGSKDISTLVQVDKRIMWEFYGYVCNYKGERGNPASNGYKNRILVAVKWFFRFLLRFEILHDDPRVDWERFQEKGGLSFTCMNKKETITLLDAPLLSRERLKLRDKAILEMLYSTGLRSNELRSLDIEDIDYEQEMVHVRSPKGGAKYQRVIPIGKTALEYLGLYLKEERPRIDLEDSQALFLSFWGKRLRKDGILDIVKKYVFLCGLRKKITTHSLRVTCATDMLRKGADIRYVQEHLGHERLTSTQIYTRVSVKDLKRVHKRYHPR